MIFVPPTVWVMTGGGKSALRPSRPRPFVPRMKNDDFSNFHLFINLQQAQPAHRTAGPGSKATIFCGRALRSRTVFTEIIISTFLPVALLSCLPVRLITIFPLFVLCFLNTGAHIATSSSLPETKKNCPKKKEKNETKIFRLFVFCFINTGAYIAASSSFEIFFRQ